MNWKLASLMGFAVIAAFVLGMLVSGGEQPQTGGTDPDAAAVAQAPTTWTCSMHPQIKLPKAGKCPICFMDLIPLSTDSGDELAPRQIRISESARQLAQIQTAPVIRGSATAELRLLGKLAYDETRLASITARAAGRVDKLFVDYTGQKVTAGDELALIYSPELFSAQQELIQAKSSVAMLANTESQSLRASAEANLAAAREKLRLLGFSSQQIEAIAQRETATEHLTITAPLSGTVVEKMVQEGQYIEMGMELYRIADLARLWVLIDAYEFDAAGIARGDKITFTSGSFPGESFEATINFISPSVDAMTRTFAVRGTIDNSRGRLKPEMFLNAELSSSRAGGDDGRLLIPATAPLLTGKRAVVYVQLANEEGAIFEGREVELGGRSGPYFVVKSGLSEGELVVINGAFKIDSELQIQAKPSMMSPEDFESTADNQNAPNTTTKATDETKTTTISATAHTALEPLYEAYFALQMALAQDDLQRARAAAQSVTKANAAIDMRLFTGDAHSLWMKHAEVIGKESQRLEESEDFKKARDAFFFLSNAMIDLHSSFGHAERRNYYLTFCPMARDNKGAFWLQTVDTVWNSFYGDEMLRCGEIKATLEPLANE